MNNKNLFWIVPIAIFISFSFGFYFAIPKTITIDYGENMLEVVEALEVLYEKNITIDVINYPPTICKCSNRTWDTDEMNDLDTYAIFPINLTEEDIIAFTNTIYPTPDKILLYPVPRTNKQ